MANKVVGKKIWAIARVGTMDKVKGKICFEEVKSTDGSFERNHAWLHFDEDRMRFLERGQVVTFTAMLSEYSGLVGDVVTKKIGMSKLRNIKVRDYE